MTLPASFLIHGSFDHFQVVAGPIFLPNLKTELRISQREIFQAESWTPFLVISFQPVIHNTVSHARVLEELVVIILNFIPVVTASKM